jgi:uncharacterized protein (DUF362 family)
MNTNFVSKIKCGVGDDLQSSIIEAVKPLGGFEAFIKPGDRVLLKPNVNTADPFPASSDPAFVRLVANLVLACNPAEVIIGDTSTFYQSSCNNFEKLCLFDLRKIDQRLKVLTFDEGKWVKKKIAGKYLKSVSVPEILDKVDKIIFLPCMKTHFVAKYTGALKLGVGLMKPSERLALHMRNTELKIAELNLAFKPDLIIMDGRKCFITKGPTEGEVREPGIILASESRVAIDIEEVKIIQSFPGNSIGDVNPEDLPQIKRAKEIGIL